MLVVLAPVAGTAIALADVPDDVFAQQLLGVGAAVDPGPDAAEVTVLAPVAGTVTTLHPHAAVLTTPTGAGVLVHVGIDTVRMAGTGFEVLVAKGAEVAAGDPLVVVDLTAVQAAGYSPVCPVVVLDSAPDSALDVVTGPVSAGEPLLRWDDGG